MCPTNYLDHADNGIESITQSFIERSIPRASAVSRS
jgi:hypothetical protein